jgi:hypothetical protein
MRNEFVTIEASKELATTNMPLCKAIQPYT